MKEIQILPFFTDHKKNIKIEHCDLKSNKTTLRGIDCEKKSNKEINLNKINLYLDSELITDWYYWMPLNEKNPSFLEGLKLVNEGIGFKETGITKFLSKK